MNESPMWLSVVVGLIGLYLFVTGIRKARKATKNGESK